MESYFTLMIILCDEKYRIRDILVGSSTELFWIVVFEEAIWLKNL